MKNTNLTEGSIAKGFILFALPLFLGSLFQQLYGTVDLIFVGNYMGKTEAAAVGAKWDTCNLSDWSLYRYICRCRRNNSSVLGRKE